MNFGVDVVVGDALVDVIAVTCDVFKDEYLANQADLCSRVSIVRVNENRVTTNSLEQRTGVKALA